MTQTSITTQHRSNVMDDDQQELGTRGTKRPAGHGTADGSKRRAPYALRACDVCRRRKGKCDGQNPCGYCRSRDLSCCFASGTGEDWRVNNGGVPDGGSAPPAPPSQPSAWNPEDVAALGQLVVNLQGQLNSLAARVRQSSVGSGSISSGPSLATQGDESHPEAVPSIFDTIADEPRPLKTAAPRDTCHRFYGPTSPDYSLNVAQLRMRQGSLSNGDTGRPGIPSIDESQAHDGGMAEPEAWPRGPGYPTDRQKLLQFRTLLPLRETVRLLFVYQEVIGDLHPIFDIERLVDQVEGWYKSAESNGRSDADREPDENSLVIANIALATALCADSTSRPNVEAELFACVSRDIAPSIFAAPATTVKDAVITLLVGIYHFFKDMPQVSWRMCGLAGRMLMELGLHNRDVSDHILSSDQQKEEIATLTCSVIILDRQWSAATGLPSSFQHSPFEPAYLATQVKTPYLKAMMAFIMISDRFSEPSSRVAKGGAYEDDDDFEIMNFQIDQWRKKTVGKYNFTQPGAWQSAPSTRPPWWTIVLYLRGNSVLGLLLRPFFFPGAAAEAGKRNIRPSLDLVSDTINILSTLDRTTDIYRKQHPHFQHLLASSCALLFLIIAYVEQNRADLSSCLPDDFAVAVGRNFKKAFALAAAYSTSSRASRRLWNRLLLLMEPLQRLGIVLRGEMNEEETAMGQRPAHGPPHQPQTQAVNKSAGRPGEELRILGSGSDDLFLQTMYLPDVMGPLAMPGPENDMTAWGGPTIDWPWNEMNNFFSDRGL